MLSITKYSNSTGVSRYDRRFQPKFWKFHGRSSVCAIIRHLNLLKTSAQVKIALGKAKRYRIRVFYLINWIFIVLRFHLASAKKLDTFRNRRVMLQPCRRLTHNANMGYSCYFSMKQDNDKCQSCWTLTFLTQERLIGRTRRKLSSLTKSKVFVNVCKVQDLAQPSGCLSGKH